MVNSATRRGRRQRDLPVFAALVLLGFSFRVFRLPDVPSGMLWDEGGFGLSALHVLQGQHPIYFSEYFGFEPLFLYTQVAALKLLGWSTFAFRLPAAFFGTLSVATTFLVGRQLLGWRIAWLGTLLSAVDFWQVVLARIGERDIAVAPLAALTIYWLVRWLRGQRPWLSAALCGVCLGVAQYTYTPARLLVVAVGLIWVVALARARKRWVLVPEAAVAALASAAVFAPLGWYVLRNPDSGFFARGVQISVLNPENGPPLQSLAHNVWDTVLMFFVHGEHGWAKNVAEQPLLNPAVAVLFAIGIVIAVARFRRFGYAVALIWLVVMTIPEALTTGISFPDFGRVAVIGPVVVLFPALTAVEAWRRWPATRWVVGVGALAAVAFGYREYFVVWADAPQREEVYRPGVLAAAESAVGRLTAADAPARVYFGPREANDAVSDFAIAGLDAEHPDLANRLVGYDARYTEVLAPGGSESYLIVPGRPAVTSLPAPAAALTSSLGDAVAIDGYTLPGSVAPGQTLELTLQWRPRQAPNKSLTFFSHLLDYSQRQQVALFDHNGFPPSEWRGGETVESHFPLAVPADTPPGAYWVELGAYVGEDKIKLRTPGGDDRLLLGPVVVMPPAASGSPAVQTGGLGDQVSLVSSDVRLDGSDLRVDLTWLPRGQLDRDYSVFVHVLDPQGKLVAQADGVPDGGRWPVAYWRPNVAVPDSHDIRLPPTLPAGQYRVAAGLYSPSGGERLAPSTAGPEPGSLLVGTVAVP